MFGDFFTSLLTTAGNTWYVWLPVFSFLMFMDVWLSYVRQIYKAGIAWTILEVRIPREILKGPKVMDQFFASIHSLKNSPGPLVEKYWEGEVTLWFSFEVVSIGGEIRFYIKLPTKHRNVVEANLYAFYSDIEIAEVADYTEKVPKNLTGLHEAGYETWGTELILSKPDGYPIRTYAEFETMDDYSKVDPITALMEVLGRVKPEEQVWVQFIVAPADERWRTAGQKLIKKLQEETVKKGAIGGQEFSMVDRTPGQVNVMKAIENNISKLGYFTMIRCVYVAPKAVYNVSLADKGVLGSLNQYASLAANSFKHNTKIKTQTSWYYAPFFYPQWRLEYRRQKIFNRYKKRFLLETSFFSFYSTGSTVSPQVYVLNTEELATLYHFPTNLVLTAPIIQRVESKKAGPPAGLPIFSGEDKLEGFK